MSEINFAEVVAQVKKAHGWNNRDIAKVLNVDPSSVSNWARGRYTPNNETTKKLLEMHREVTSPLEIPLEAPEVLDPLVKKYCEEDEKTVLEVAESYIPKIEDLEPTAIERLNPPDTTSINQTPIRDGYSRFLENLRFFMKDTRLDTDEKLETYVGMPEGYISEFGNHGDRFEELTYIDAICDAIGVPWAVLAFSNAAKEDRLARLNVEIDRAKEALALLINKRNEIAEELNVDSVGPMIDMATLFTNRNI